MEYQSKKRRVCEQTWVFALFLSTMIGLLRVFFEVRLPGYLDLAVESGVLALMGFRLFIAHRRMQKDGEKGPRASAVMLTVTMVILLSGNLAYLFGMVWEDEFIRYASLLLFPLLFYTVQSSFQYLKDGRDAASLFYVTGFGFMFSLLVLAVRVITDASGSLDLVLDGKVLPDLLLFSSVAVFLLSFLASCVSLITGRVKRHGLKKRLGKAA